MKNLKQSIKPISSYFIFIAFTNPFKTSFLSFGEFIFDRKSPMMNLSKPFTTNKNSPNSSKFFIILLENKYK